jgi:hypothetical protein
MAAKDRELATLKAQSDLALADQVNKKDAEIAELKGKFEKVEI